MSTDARGIWTHASNAQADFLCPGRHLAQRGIPEPPPGPDAEFGRRVHDALATGNPKGLKPAEEQAYEDCRAVEQAALQKWLDLEPENTAPVVVHREERIWGKMLGKYPHSGRFDVRYRQGARVLIGDYKSLRGHVPDASINKQLRDLAVLQWMQDALVASVSTVILQPPADRVPIICFYNEADLRLAAQEVAGRVEQSNNPQSQRIAGELQCQFCLAKHGCEAHKAWIGPALPVVRDILAVPAERWTPEEWSVFLDRRRVAFDWLKSTEEMAKQMLRENPDAIPGYRLVPNADRHPINNPTLVFERFAKLGGDAEAFMTCVEVRKQALEACVRALTGAKGKGLKSAMEALTEGATGVSSVSPSIIKEGK